MSEQIKVLCFFLSRKKSLSSGRCAGPCFLKKRSKKLLLVACVALFSGSAVAADGKYLARMADCAACHMGADGTLSGGRAFATPFGTIYATNITPDAKHGVGGYSDDEWVEALQRGVARGGKHLYPAMPYTNYTLMTRADALAIKAYVMSLPASAAEPPANEMRFPFNIRWLMVFWNWLYNPNHRFAPDGTHDAAWNRGAYLAEALGHCQQCHTPRNFLQGPKTGQAYAGAVQQGWMAYNITSDAQSGIGGWSQADIAAYLSSGHADGHGPASGPMAEAVSYSLRYLTGEDAQALAAYLKTIPALHTTPPPPAVHVAEDELGARIYEGACASCHRPDGTGTETPMAALAGDQTAMDPQGTNLVRVLTTGGAVTTSLGSFAMPGFARGYTDTELAAVANYTIEHFGQRVGRVTPGVVAALRSQTSTGPAAGRGAGS
jgi:mono/diheme cytochrome c family protein